MTIRNRLTLRFTALVSSILLLAFVSLYAFCWYFVTSDFYRRLDRKAATMGDLLIRYRWDRELIHRMSLQRRDRLPNQKIRVYDNRDSLIYDSNRSLNLPITASALADIRQEKQRDFYQAGYYLSASRYVTASGVHVVIASAQNRYGDRFLRQLLWALAGLFALIVGITAFAGRLFAADALRPMQRIDERLNQIFPHNQDERLPIRNATDEIGRLSQTVNRLLDRVAETFRLQRLFVANVSHELKNPLTQISSQLEVSLLNTRDAQTYQRTIRSVLDDIRSLAELTHELLQLSRVHQSNASVLLSQQVRLDDIIWDVRDEVSALSNTYQVKIELGTLPDDPDALTIRGNRRLLCTALKNLIENACKFSPNGQAVVWVYTQPRGVGITVENQGDPIPADDLPYLFEPFYRGQKTADQVRGYGVGLSLVERIIRLHGGSIAVQSDPGKPTQFRVELPNLAAL